MKAVHITRYGSPDVLRVKEMPRPEIRADEMLVRVHAASVTTADWRLRAAAFPRGMRILGRLFAGILRPRHAIPGVDFAGTVVAAGSEVRRFAPGDAVFGYAGHGGQAEYVAVKAEGPVAGKPDALSFAEAVSLPFGADTAMSFLERFAQVRPGERVLVTGASGGVGYWAVQIARLLGAEVTAMASAANHGLLRELGAAHVIDYRHEDVTASQRSFDVILDCVGVLRFGRARRILRPGGRFAVLQGGLRELVQALVPRRRGGKRVVFNVAMATGESLERLAGLAAEGRIRAVIGRRFGLEAIAEAHALVESRHQVGTTVIEVLPAAVKAVA